VVCISLHQSLDAEINMKIGSSLAPLRDDKVLIIGSGYSFHNMGAFFNSSRQTLQASVDFNRWLKETILEDSTTEKTTSHSHLEKLKQWQTAPGARISHPREEHLLPLLIAAAAGGTDALPKLIYDTTIYDSQAQLSEHAVTGYLFL